jgi:hypothetical protein
MNLLITGQLRDSEKFLSEFLLPLLGDCRINQFKIVISTWEKQDTEKIECLLKDIAELKVIKIKLRIRDLRPKSTYKLQERLFKLGLEEFNETDVVFKIRTDLYLDCNIVYYLANKIEILDGTKIWVPNYSPESMGMFADLAFCGTKNLLSHVYQPKGLCHTARSSNGMKSHLDTWSGYLFHRDPNLLQIINWSSNFFKFTESLKFYLVSKDLVHGEFKEKLWHSRHTVLSRYQEFTRLREWYNLSIGKYFIIGTEQDVQNIYLRRVGPNFHLQSTYSRDSGHFVSEKLEVNPKSSLSGNELKILDHKFCEISKEIMNAFNHETKPGIFWLRKLRLLSKAEYNYSKSVLRILLKLN